MGTVIFLPGIQGSELHLNGDQVWPPTRRDLLTGYGKVDQLLDPAVTVGPPIRKVCVSVYDGLLDALGQLPNWSLETLPYDWRGDLRDLGRFVAETIAATAARSGGSDIAIVAHSMGGLIARYALEAASLDGDWRRHVTLLVLIAVPHAGAPLALARIGGNTVEGTPGIGEADLVRMSNDPRYPSGYQLLPGLHLPVAWNLDAATPLDAYALSDRRLEQAAGLNRSMVEAAADFRAQLDWTRRPPRTRYVAVVGCGHRSVTRFDLSLQRGMLNPVWTDGSGDGTVPTVSAGALPVPTAYVAANHLGITRHDETLRLIRMLLGVESPGAVAAQRDGGVRPNVSVDRMSYRSGDDVEVLVTLPPGLPSPAVRIIRHETPEPVAVWESALAELAPEIRNVAFVVPIAQHKAGRLSAVLTSEGRDLAETDFLITARAAE